jgi:hypothetical protein
MLKLHLHQFVVSKDGIFYDAYFTHHDKNDSKPSEQN